MRETESLPAAREVPLVPRMVPGPAEPTDVDADADGLITGALKKTGAVAGASIARTGDAIAKTGAVAGASIVDAFKGLFGAVKKVSPFTP